MKNLEGSDLSHIPFNVMLSIIPYKKGTRIRRCTEGVMVYDGCEWKPFKGSTFDSDTWKDWTFELNGKVFKGDELV